MSYEFLRVHSEGPVGWLEYNRPPRNAFHQAMIGECLQAFAELGGDPSVRAIVVASALDDYFSVGADLAIFGSLGPGGMAQWIAQVHNLARAVHRSAKPMLAAIRGVAVGGGLEMALHCDVRFAAQDARFGLPEVNINFIPPVGTTLSLPRLLGRHGAIRFLYDGEMVDARRALEIGLVDELAPPAELRARVQAYGEALAGKPPEVLAAIRRCIRDGLELDFEAALALEQETVLELARTENFREGVAAFLAKRKPVWK
jgi:enoyl-CoA hydratase/carnithine racemase